MRGRSLFSVPPKHTPLPPLTPLVTPSASSLPLPLPFDPLFTLQEAKPKGEAKKRKRPASGAGKVSRSKVTAPTHAAVTSTSPSSDRLASVAAPASGESAARSAKVEDHNDWGLGASAPAARAPAVDGAQSGGNLANPDFGLGAAAAPVAAADSVVTAPGVSAVAPVSMGFASSAAADDDDDDYD